MEKWRPQEQRTRAQFVRPISFEQKTRRQDTAGRLWTMLCACHCHRPWPAPGRFQQNRKGQVDPTQPCSTASQRSGYDSLGGNRTPSRAYGSPGIMVVNANRQYACFVFGQGATLLAILHEDKHYDTLTSLPGFFRTSYFCGWCLKPYNEQGSEGKGVHCPGCQQNECNNYIEAYLRKRPAHIPCRHCHPQFYGDACFQLHQTKTLSGKACGPNQSLVCDSWRKCANCIKLLSSMNEQDEHRCGYSECPSCHETTDLNQHQCFVQVPTDPEELEDRACIVQSNKWTQLHWEARNDRNTVMEGEEEEEEEEDNTCHPTLLVFWDMEAMQDTGMHVPNLVVGITAEDASPQILCGENCIEQFLQWLEELTEQDTRYITALAHNFKGYD